MAFMTKNLPLKLTQLQIEDAARSRPQAFLIYIKYAKAVAEGSNVGRTGCLPITSLATSFSIARYPAGNLRFDLIQKVAARAMQIQSRSKIVLHDSKHRVSPDDGAHVVSTFLIYVKCAQSSG
jgi:hypothetical protein